MTSLVISLDSADCLDVAACGDKAARLARARASGFPVLPGFVVPTAASREALAAAAGNPYEARLAVMDWDTAALAPVAAAARALAAPVVVRSSSPVEGSGRWAGAFASYVGVESDDVLTAVRGVWASAITSSAPDAAEPGGIVPEMAVLVQPEVRPQYSGAARADPDGAVAVTAVRGAPAALMTGWSRGVSSRVTPDGRVDGDRAFAEVGPEVLNAVARMVRALQAATGDSVVEWAAVDGAVVLLQCRGEDRPPAPATAGDVPLDAIQVTPADGLPAISRYSRAYAGPLGDLLVLPWWLADEASCTVRPADGPGDSRREPDVTAAQAGVAWARALTLADELTSQVPRGPRGAPGNLVPTVNLGAARQLLGSCQTVGRYLVQGGWIGRDRELWLMTADEVTRLIERSPNPPERAVLDRRERQAARRWEPLLFAAIMNEGERTRGDAAAPGSGAGPVRLAGTPQSAVPGNGRYVLVARYPLPRFAPLLWSASGLVTSEGNPGAHLIEVARSLGVPAVVGCAEADPETIEAGSLAAVDGDLGVVALAPCAPA